MVVQLNTKTSSWYLADTIIKDRLIINKQNIVGYTQSTFFRKYLGKYDFPSFKKS